MIELQIGDCDITLRPHAAQRISGDDADIALQTWYHFSDAVQALKSVSAVVHVDSPGLHATVIRYMDELRAELGELTKVQANSTKPADAD